MSRLNWKEARLVIKFGRKSKDDNLRRWVSYILGYGKSRFLEAQIEELARLDPEVHFAASVLWQLLASWIYELKEY